MKLKPIVKKSMLAVFLSGAACTSVVTAAFAESARFKTSYKPINQHIVQHRLPVVIYTNQPTVRLQRSHGFVNKKRYIRRVNAQQSQSPWYSPHNAFKVAKHPEKPVLMRINHSNKTNLRQLRRGQYLSDDIYQQGVIVFRAPRGIAVLRVGNISIKFHEKTRKIISVISP